MLILTMTATGLAGCLTGDDTASDTDHEQSPSPGNDEMTPTTDSDNADPSPTPTPEDEPTPTPEETPTESDGEDESTPSPPDGEADDEVFPDYEMTSVAVRSPDGELLGWVRAAVADTGALRFTGLSETEEMPEDYGMLFVFGEVDDKTFVMRDMDFGIDIIYVDEDGRINEIYHAPEPGPDEDGSEQRYPGRGKYVLETNKHWTTENGVEEGDYLNFEL